MAENVDGGVALAKVSQAARRLNLGRTTVYELMDKGELPYVKIGKSRRIEWAEVEKLIRKGRVG